MSVTDSSSLGDNLTAWEVVDGDYDYRKSLSVRPKFSWTSKPVLRVFKKGDVFLSVGPGKKGKAKEFTRHQLEDGGWVSSTERHSRICAVQISAEVYAKKKKAQDNRESDQQNAEEKKEQEAEAEPTKNWRQLAKERV